jgi:hypothetical protein
MKILRSVHAPPPLPSLTYFLVVFFLPLGAGIAVGIATRYGLKVPGIESRWGRDFTYPSGPGLGPNQPSIQWVPGLFPGIKRPERGVDHPLHLMPRLKKE